MYWVSFDIIYNSEMSINVYIFGLLFNYDSKFHMNLCFPWGTWRILVVLVLGFRGRGHIDIKF